MRRAGYQDAAVAAQRSDRFEQPMRAEHVRRQRRGRVPPRLGNLRQAGAMEDRRWIEVVNRGGDGVAIEEVDRLPLRERRDLGRRGRPRPADDGVRPGKMLDQMAAGEPGCAGYENWTVHSSSVPGVRGFTWFAVRTERRSRRGRRDPSP